jgi:hypothetical protein
MTHRKQPIGQSLLLLAAFAALYATARAQSQAKDPSKFDIAGVRLGMTVDQVEAAIRADGSMPHIKRWEWQSEIGGKPYIQAISAATNDAGPYAYAGSHMLVVFTETEGNGAYVINRELYFDSIAPLDVTVKQAMEKYGTPPPQGTQPAHVPGQIRWVFDPAGKPVPEDSLKHDDGGHSLWDYCNIPPAPVRRRIKDGLTDLADQVHSFTLNIPPFGPLPPHPGGLVDFYDGCGVSLFVNAKPDFMRKQDPAWVGSIVVALVDNQLEVRNLTKIVTAKKAAQAQRDAELRKKAEQAKPPF